jgi:signal transduction histidine kinase
LIARCAAGLRAASAVAAGIAAFVGLAPPASLLAVAVAAAGLVGWAAGYVAVALRRGLVGPLVLGDIAVAVGLCLAHAKLVPATVLPDGSSWVYVAASATVIASALNPRLPLGMLATVLVTAAHAGGLLLGGETAPSGFSAVLLVQGSLVGSLMLVLRRSSRAADAAIAEHEAVAADAAVRSARRAEEREYSRLLHDSVSATLTVVSAGGMTDRSPTLRAQARRDLEVVERLQSPAAGSAGGASAGADPAGGEVLGRWLAPVAATAGPALILDLAAASLEVPAAVGAALAAAVAEALTNIARHAQASQARLRTQPAPGGGVLVELVDDGVGFDPVAVPASRRGIRESVVGRMHAVGGSAALSSAPGGGTRILLRWPADPAAAR